ncbi:MAG: pyridoxal phosphate-dependent aminotransferase [Deltaproteobacteria bacterium]|nr:pyridoxal phosphate-dependent aminotransferase [Deltaproteobacteria bacterium]
MSIVRLASRLAPIKPSITLAVTAKAAKLRAEGMDVIGFGAGEPDFDTPAHIKEAAKRALDLGDTKYTHVAGTPSLRKAVAKELERAHGLRFSPEQVIVSVGAKHSLYNLFQVLLDPGDEVIIPAPYWVSYPDMVMLADGKPVILPTTAASGFRVTPESLRMAITPRTRAFVLNSPSNPTGAGYDRASLEALRPIFEEHEILVVSDDIYRRLVYGDFVFHQIATLSPKMAELTVVVDGLSKSHAMTGWRIGFMAGPKPIIDAVNTLQGQSTSNITSIAQAAAVAALEGPEECVEVMRREFDKRRSVMVDGLRSIPGVRCFDPQGAFYAFPDVSAYVGKHAPTGKQVQDDVALCDYLLDEGKIAVVPGSGFGAPGFVRLSYATSMENITRGIARMADALSRLS